MSELLGLCRRFDAPLSLSFLVVLRVLTVSFFVVVYLILGVLPEAELSSNLWEHEVEELSCLPAQFLLVQSSEPLFLFSQIFLRLQSEKGAAEYFKDFHEEDEDEKGSAEVAQSDISICVSSLIVEVD
jgi:hypothetical protein